LEHIRWFEEITAADMDVVGGKGANLGEMVAAGLPVPPGFCITTSGYREFIEGAGLDQAIDDILSQVRGDDPARIVAGAARIRSLIAAQPVPAVLACAITRGYHRLGQLQGAEDPTRTPVAVRSSATAEDLLTASFAGQQDTYLNVRGDLDLLDRVRDCWASLWTDRAVLYRAEQGFDHRGVCIAAVVQAMVPSEVSGILFTANPVTGDRSQAVINASWGLGEAIVSGHVTPDTFTVRSADGEILSRQIAAKTHIIQYAEGGGTVELPAPAGLRDVPALSDQQVSALADLGRRIERHFGAPQDIEWALADGRFYVLQSRPITALTPSSEGDVEVEYNRTMFVELFPDPLCPAFLSVIEPLIHSMLDFALEGLGFEPPADMEAVGVFYSQPYFSRTYIAEALQVLSPDARESMVSQIMNPWARHERGLRRELSLPYLRMAARLLRFLATFRHQLPDLVAQHRAGVASLEAQSLADTPEAELVASARRLIFNHTRRLLDYDFLLIALTGLSYQMLGSLLERYSAGDSEELQAKLISGVTGNVTMETNKHLWDLAQVAKVSPAVSDLLRTHDPAEVVDRLEQMEEGKAFLQALDLFLDEYGHREIRMDVLYPTWGEDPAPVLGFVRGYLDVGEAHNPYPQQARLVEEREELTKKVLGQLERDLLGRTLVSPIFRWVLGHSQANTRERDTAHFELTRVFPPIRRLLLELGPRWTARGLTDKPDDIFFLRLEEIEEMALVPRPMKDVVQARRAEFEEDKLRPWPDIIRGDQETYAQGPPEEGLDGQLQGIASSPGVVSGVARVIRGPHEFGRLQKDDVLVAPLTNPAWTPLFAIASAVITEVGGILSHGAIVAREYGIPAVMSVAGATTRVPDGDPITVDGNSGLVHLKETRDGSGS
jgi:phosphohistidine swiveling domain-containing protein